MSMTCDVCGVGYPEHHRIYHITFDLRSSALLTYLQFLSDRHDRHLKEGWPDKGYDAGLDEVRRYVRELMEPKCICGTDEAIARGEAVHVRSDVVCPKHDGGGWVVPPGLQYPRTFGQQVAAKSGLPRDLEARARDIEKGSAS